MKNVDHQVWWMFVEIGQLQVVRGHETQSESVRIFELGGVAAIYSSALADTESLSTT